MTVSARAVLWKERIAQWYASGLSQAEYGRQIGVGQKRISYWANRLKALDMLPAELCAPAEPSPSDEAALPAFLPVQIDMPMVEEPPLGNSIITLRSERGWTLNLPNDVPASWLAELMRGL